MTPTESLATIGWTLAELARQGGYPVPTVKSWYRRGSWPPRVTAWLAELAAAHIALPGPRLG